MNGTGELIGSDFVSSYLNASHGDENNECSTCNSDKDSLLHCLFSKAQNKQNYSNDKNSRSMILGPTGCGKTSLVMDHAYSITSTAYCRPRNVAILTHLSCDKHQRRFPLPCTCHQRYQDNDKFSETWKNNKSDAYEHASALFQSRLSALESNSSMQEKNFETKKSHAQVFNDKALEQISIHYLSNLDEIIRYLIIVPLLTRDERPNGGIIIDDLHLFFKQDPQTKHENLDDKLSMKLLQLVALMDHTATYLKSSCSSQDEIPIIILTWDISIIPLPQHTQQYLSNFVPFFATVASVSNLSSNLVSHKNSRTIFSTWKVTLCNLQYHPWQMISSDQQLINSSEDNTSFKVFYEICSRSYRINDVQHMGTKPFKNIASCAKELIWTK